MTVKTKKEIKAALKNRDPILRDFFLGRITESQCQQRLQQLEKEESLSEKRG